MNEIEIQLASMSELERRNWLDDNASKIEENQTYHRTMTNEEIIVSKEIFAEHAIVLNAKTEEFKEIKSEFTKEAGKIQDQMKAELNKFKTGKEELKGNLYFMDDQNNSLMYVYDQTGQQIECRPLRPNEKQKTIFTLKTGTDNGN